MSIQEILNSLVVRRIIFSVIIILVVVVVWFVVNKIIRLYRKHHQAEDPQARASTLKLVISDIVKASIILLVVLTILQVNGVNVTSLLAGVGVVGAVVGLALQDFLKDIIMGIHILIDNFFDVGDVVQFGEEEGIVESFNLRTTKIRSIVDADLVTICNRNIDKIIKTSGQKYIHFPLPYELPVEEAEEVIDKIVERASSNDAIASVVYLGTNGFESSYIDYLIKVDAATPDAYLRAKRAVYRASQDVLAEKGISIPYEQLDVHMKG